MSLQILDRRVMNRLNAAGAVTIPRVSVIIFRPFFMTYPTMRTGPGGRICIGALRCCSPLFLLGNVNLSNLVCADTGPGMEIDS